MVCPCGSSDGIDYHGVTSMAMAIGRVPLADDAIDVTFGVNLEKLGLLKANFAKRGHITTAGHGPQIVDESVRGV